MSEMRKVLALRLCRRRQMYRPPQNRDRSTHARALSLSKGMEETKMLVRNGWRVLMLCLLATGAIATGRAQTVESKPISQALTFNGDGAQRSGNIHWPDGFHPEQADLFAHNEIVVHASCEKVFA